MPGPLFIHVQTYSRKLNQAGNAVDQVIGEGIRNPEFSVHVEDPKPPRVFLGDPSTFKAEHDAHVKSKATRVMVKGVEKSRAIRNDRHTLATIIASYPLTQDQIDEGGNESADHHKAWEQDTIAFVQTKYGAQLKVVFAHDDEAHPHLHFWLLPDNPDADAKMLHPGKIAKTEVEAAAKSEGITPRDAVRLGNAALKVAMRGFLDSYFHEVAEPLGMLRDGPKRRRESRAQYKSRLAEATRCAASFDRAKQSEATADAAKEEIESMEQRLKNLRRQVALEEDNARNIIANARTTATKLMADAKTAVVSMNAAALSEIDSLKKAARTKGFKAGYAEARSEITEMRRMFESIMPEFTGLVLKMKGVMRDVRIDLKIRNVAKVIFSESEGFTSKLDKLRKAIRRSASDNYIGGVVGKMEREQDARILAPYHQELTRQTHQVDADSINPKAIKNKNDDFSVEARGQV